MIIAPVGPQFPLQWEWLVTTAQCRASAEGLKSWGVECGEEVQVDSDRWELKLAGGSFTLIFYAQESKTRFIRTTGHRPYIQLLYVTWASQSIIVSVFSIGVFWEETSGKHVLPKDQTEAVWPFMTWPLKWYSYISAIVYWLQLFRFKRRHRSLLSKRGLAKIYSCLLNQPL